jgi:hypothetical protein
MDFKVGDVVYLKAEVCEYYRIEDKPYVIMALKYSKKTYSGPYSVPPELYYYTIEYGEYGHDVRISDVDYYKTIRIMKLNELGI